MSMPPTSSRRKKKIFRSEDIALYHESLLLMGLSRNTADSYSKDIKSFFRYVDGEIAVDDFNYCAMHWLNERKKQKLAPKTLGRHMCSLKSFASWAQLPNELNRYKLPKPLAYNPHPLPEGMQGVHRMIEATEN